MAKRSLALLALTCLLLALAACGNNSNVAGLAPSATTAATTTTISQTTTASASTQNALASFKITAVDMAVSPSSIAGLACGSSINVVYTATFHATANSGGGTVQFLYTTNNGRSSQPSSLTFAPGQTVKTFSFNWQGTLQPDNVNPGLGGILVNSPNSLQSPMVKPTGTCTSKAPFKVTSIDLAVSPSSIAGRACNTAITLTYNVTFHIAPNSAGGTIQFGYTTNNGRSQTSASVSVGPGATTKTFTFTSSGTLYADHTFPGIAIIMVNSPNTLLSAGVKPIGTCS